MNEFPVLTGPQILLFGVLGGLIVGLVIGWSRQPNKEIIDKITQLNHDKTNLETEVAGLKETLKIERKTSQSRLDAINKLEQKNQQLIEQSKKTGGSS